MSIKADAPGSRRPAEKLAADARNPWTTLRSSQVYENGWIAVDDREVRDASGAVRPYGVVRFKVQGRCILPIDDEGFTYLVGQYRYAADRYSWELPAGGSDPDETPLQSAVRELKEETGLEARHWLELLDLSVSGSITDERAACFLAWGIGQSDRDLDDQEVVRVRRVPFADALDMALRGGIDAAVSVAAILSAHARAVRGTLPDDVARLLGRAGPHREASA